MFHTNIQSSVWKRHVGALAVGHQHGGRKSMKTSGIHFCYKRQLYHSHEQVTIHINTSQKTSTVQIVTRYILRMSNSQWRIKTEKKIFEFSWFLFFFSVYRRFFSVYHIKLQSNPVSGADVKSIRDREVWSLLNGQLKILSMVQKKMHWVTLTLSKDGGGGGGGGRKVPALTFNGYNFFKIQPNAARLCDFLLNLSGNNLVG